MRFCAPFWPNMCYSSDPYRVPGCMGSMHYMSSIDWPYSYFILITFCSVNCLQIELFTRGPVLRLWDSVLRLRDRSMWAHAKMVVMSKSGLPQNFCEKIPRFFQDFSMTMMGLLWHPNLNSAWYNFILHPRRKIEFYPIIPAKIKFFFYPELRSQSTTF